MAVFFRVHVHTFQNVPEKKSGGSFENHSPTFGVVKLLFFGEPLQKRRKDWLVFRGEKGWQIHQCGAPKRSTKKKPGQSRPRSQIPRQKVGPCGAVG